MKGSWKNIEKNKPPFNTSVELCHMITGIGAPEREGWESTGYLRDNGRFVIKQTPDKKVDFRPPTHWREIKEK